MIFWEEGLCGLNGKLADGMYARRECLRGALLFVKGVLLAYMRFFTNETKEWVKRRDFLLPAFFLKPKNKGKTRTWWQMRRRMREMPLKMRDRRQRHVNIAVRRRRAITITTRSVCITRRVAICVKLALLWPRILLLLVLRVVGRVCRTRFKAGRHWGSQRTRTLDSSCSYRRR